MLDPIAIQFLGLQIRWYGLVYFFGFLITYLIFLKSTIDLSKEQKEDIFFWFMLSSIIGGRIFYIIFYNPVYYINNLLDIFAFWKGGMSIHGGIFFGFMSIYIYSKKYKINHYKILDFLVIPLSLFLSIGRLANLVNQELYGYIIQNNNFKFLGIVFDRVDNELRYPTQIFSSIKNFIVFYILSSVKYYKKDIKTGLIAGWFLILYNFGRFFIDFLRVPTGTGNTIYNLIGISMGQLLCLIFGIWGIFIVNKSLKN